MRLLQNNSYYTLIMRTTKYPFTFLLESVEDAANRVWVKGFCHKHIHTHIYTKEVSLMPSLVLDHAESRNFFGAIAKINK